MRVNYLDFNYRGASGNKNVSFSRAAAGTDKRRRVGFIHVCVCAYYHVARQFLPVLLSSASKGSAVKLLTWKINVQLGLPKLIAR